MGNMGTPLFNSIKINTKTGEISYPKLPGFELDMEQVYLAAARNSLFCNGNMEMALRHAIHGQLAAHQGMMSLRRKGN